VFRIFIYDEVMNKAFTREPDPAETARCPHCGSIGLPVTRETLESFVLPGALAAVAESAFFCPYPTCEIVYFDVFDRSLDTDSIKKQVYPKDPNAPICGCFGLTLDDIEQDVREGVVTRCKELITKAKSDAARCSVMSPSGQSCIPEVQRQFIKRREP
jgi:Zinc binding domain